MCEKQAPGGESEAEYRTVKGNIFSLFNTPWPEWHDLLTFSINQTKSHSSHPHPGLHHPPTVYTKLYTPGRRVAENQPPLLYLCGQMWTKSSLTLQSHVYAN